MTKVFRLKNQLSELGGFHQDLTAFLEEHEVSDELAHDAVLLSEELLVNTISHGYGPEPEEAWLEVRVEVKDSQRVSLVFVDQAPEFNPLEAQERDLSEDREGGWGVPLLRALAQNIYYERKSGKNILRFECSTSAAQAD